MDVASYCLRYIGVPFRWGESDCAHFAAGWAREGLGAVALPVPRVRPHWGAALSSSPNRLAALAKRWMSRAGLTLAGAPSAGCVGLIEGKDGFGFAICAAETDVGSVWAVRTPDGIALVPAEPLACWR